MPVVHPHDTSLGRIIACLAARLNPALYISAGAKEYTWFEHETILMIAYFADPD